jgi:hypothetical protein
VKESLDLLKLCSDVESRASAVGDAAVGGGEVVTAAMVSIYRGGCGCGEDGEESA